MQFKPYIAKQLKMIYSARSIWVPAAHTLEPVTAYIMQSGDSPKRLLTYHCNKDWLEHTVPTYEIKRMPKNFIEPLGQPFALNLDVMPNDVQTAVTNIIFENNFKTAFFNLPTGVGKTLMAIYLTSLLGVKSWCMCYRTIVLSQWVSTLTDMTTMDPKRLRHVNTSEELLKMAIGDYPFSKYDMWLSTPMILIQFAKRYGLDLLNDVFNNAGIGVKYFDEAHRNVGNITKINALTNVDRTYYLSADFKQSSSEKERLYYKMFGRTPIIRTDRQGGSGDRYTVGCLVRYNTHPGFAQTESAFTKYGFNSFRYMEYEIEHPEFYRVLSEVLKSIRNVDKGEGYRTLIMCNLIKHVDLLKDRVKEIIDDLYGPMDAPKIGRYHSQMPEEEKEETLNHADIIVSTYQSMGVGVDTKMLRYVISLSPMSIIDDNQAAGRARPLPDGNDTYYFMFVDDGFEYLNQKLEYRIQYLFQQKLKALTSIQYS